MLEDTQLCKMQINTMELAFMSSEDGYTLL